MKRVAVPTQPVITFFVALFLVVALTLAGCSASTISGPDVAPSEELTVQEVASTPGPNGVHNEGAGKHDPNGSGNTAGNSNGGNHN